MCRLYFRLCKRYGPGGMTISAWLWKRELEGKGSLCRDIVDITFLCFRDQADHCERQYQIETRKI